MFLGHKTSYAIVGTWAGDVRVDGQNIVVDCKGKTTTISYTAISDISKVELGHLHFFKSERNSLVSRRFEIRSYNCC